MLEEPSSAMIIRIPIIEALKPRASHAVGNEHIKDDAAERLIPAEDDSGERRTKTRPEGAARGSCKDNG